MIVIVACEFDPHSDAIVLALREMGYTDVLRIDLEHVQNRQSVTFSAEAGHAIWATLSSKSHVDIDCQLDQIRSVYWRRVYSTQQHDAWLVPKSDCLDNVEAYWATRWLLESLDDSRFPLSHPLAMHIASNKITQLSLASALGLRIPATLFSNDPSRISGFCEEHERLAVKPLRTLMTVDGNELSPTKQVTHLYASAVSAATLKQVMAGETEAALFCQECVAKRGDVRLNILPNDAVACYIDGSTVGAGEIDWRPNTFEHRHEVIHVPTEIERTCREYLRRLNLRWGAFDFGVTTQDEWVFFECNPNGQWLWIEMKTGYPLSQKFAEALLHHHTSADNVI